MTPSISGSPANGGLDLVEHRLREGVRNAASSQTSDDRSITTISSTSPNESITSRLTLKATESPVVKALPMMAVASMRPTITRAVRAGRLTTLRTAMRARMLSRTRMYRTMPARSANATASTRVMTSMGAPKMVSTALARLRSGVGPGPVSHDQPVGHGDRTVGEVGDLIGVVTITNVWLFFPVHAHEQLHDLFRVGRVQVAGGSSAHTISGSFTRPWRW